MAEPGSFLQKLLAEQERLRKARLAAAFPKPRPSPKSPFKQPLKTTPKAKPMDPLASQYAAADARKGAPPSVLPQPIDKRLQAQADALPFALGDAVESFRKGGTVVRLKPEFAALSPDGKDYIPLTRAMAMLDRRGLSLNQMGLQPMDEHEQAESLSPRTFPLARRGGAPIATVKQLSDELPDRLFQSGREKVFAPLTENFDQPLAQLYGLVMAVPDAFISHARTSAWSEKQRQQYRALSDAQKRGLSRDELRQMAGDTFGAAGNEVVAMVVVGDPLSGLSPASRLTKARQIMDDVVRADVATLAKSLVKVGRMDVKGAAESALRLQKFAKSATPEQFAQAMQTQGRDVLGALPVVTRQTLKGGTGLGYRELSPASPAALRGAERFLPAARNAPDSSVREPRRRFPVGDEDIQRVPPETPVLAVRLTDPADIQAVGSGPSYGVGNAAKATSGFGAVTGRQTELASHFKMVGEPGFGWATVPDTPWGRAAVERLGLKVDDGATRFFNAPSAPSKRYPPIAKLKATGDKGYQSFLSQSPKERPPLFGVREPSAAPKPSGRPSAAATARDAGRLVFGNISDRLKRLGPPGVEISRGLDDVLDLAGRRASTLIHRVDDVLRDQFGPMSRVTKEGRALLKGVAKKVEDGEKLTTKEQKVWDAWVSANDELRSDATRSGAWVNHMAGEAPNDKLAGEEIRIMRFAVDRVGKTTRRFEDATLQGFTPKGLPVVLQGGKVKTLPSGTRFQARQLADPKTFFPRSLKGNVADRILDEASNEHKKAVAHLVKTGQAKTAADAKAMLTKEFRDDTDAPRSLLRFPRHAIELPPEFYERDFTRTGYSHLRTGSLDVAHAEVWGRDGEKLAALIDKLGTPAAKKEAADLVATALGKRAPTGRGARFAHAVSGIEGSFTALTKLTGGSTGIIQLTQLASGIGTLGVKAGAQAAGIIAKSYAKATLDSYSSIVARLRNAIGRKAWAEAADLIDTMPGVMWKDVKAAPLMKELRDSGVMDQDVLDLLGFQDVPQAIRAVTDVGITLTGLKHTDRALRYWASVQGEIAVKDALHRLSRGPKFLRGGGAADRRLLSDWFGYSDDRITAMLENGMSADDRLKAWAGGVKTQVRVRSADLPPLVTTAPYGRMVMRLQTFQYGAARIAGWAVKEASKGNPKPLLRMATAFVVGGEGVLRLKDWAIDKIEQYGENLAASEHPVDALVMTMRMDAPENEFEGEWDDAVEAVKKKGDWEPLLDRAYANVLDSGVLGFWGYPFEAVQYEGERAKKGQTGPGFTGADMFLSRLSPPVVDTGINIVTAGSNLLFGAVMRVADEERPLSKAEIAKGELRFIERLKREGMILGTEEIVLFKRLYRSYHGGDLPRQAYAKDDRATAKPKAEDPSSAGTSDFDDAALKKRMDDFWKSRGKPPGGK